MKWASWQQCCIASDSSSTLKLHFNEFSSKFERHSLIVGMSASLSHHILCRSCNRKLKLTKAHSKSYGGHIWSNQKIRFLVREFALTMGNTQGIYDVPPACLPLHIFVMHLFLLTPCLPVFVFSSHSCYPFSSVWWCRRPDWRVSRSSTLLPPKHSQEGTAPTGRDCDRHQQSDNCSPSWNSMAQSGSLPSVAVAEYLCWLKQGVGFCEYSLAVSCWFCLQACKPCSPLKSVTWLCMTVISGWNRKLSGSICFEGAKYN